MLDDGNWLLPRLYDGQVELQKPPAFYWLVAGVGWLRGGVDSVAVRLPAVLAGLITVLLVWRHMRQRGRPIAGFIAAATLAGAVHFTGTARIGRIDVPLACVVTAIMLLSRDAMEKRAASRSAVASRLHVWVIGLLAGIALLLKGPIGIVLPAAAIFVVFLVERRSFASYVGSAIVAASIALAIALPWYLWANAATDGEFFRVFFLYHHFNRAFGGAPALAGHPFWFYIPRFAGDFLPWTPLFLAALIARRWRGDPDARFALIWFAVMFAVLSCSRFKRADYLLPAYPGAAIFLGCALERWFQTRSLHGRRWLVAGFAIVLALLPVWWLGFDRLVTAKEEAAHDQAPFVAKVREIVAKPQPVILFRVESHLLAFQLGRPLHTLVEWAELDAILREPGVHCIVTRAEFVDEVFQHVQMHSEIIARTDADQPPQHRPLVLLRFNR